MKPGTSGQTTGRNNSETKHSACASCVEVKGRRNNSTRRIERQRPAAAQKRSFGTAYLVIRNRQAAFGDVKNALGRAAVVDGIVQHALAQRGKN